MLSPAEWEAMVRENNQTRDQRALDVYGYDLRAFNKNEPRDPKGRWSGAGGLVGKAKELTEGQDDDPIGRAQDHAGRVVSGMGIHKDHLGAEMRRQATLTPRAMLRLDAVRFSNETDDRFNSRGVHQGRGKPFAVYESHHGPSTIIVSDQWQSQDGSMAKASMVTAARDEGFFSPTHGVRSEIPGVGSALSSTAAHEYGHHVANGWSHDGRHPGRKRVTAAIVAHIPGAVEVPDAADTYGGFSRWFDKNKKAIRNAVSAYAATNLDEFLAEVWSEYSTMGDDARPHIKAIGDAIREVAEEYE